MRPSIRRPVIALPLLLACLSAPPLLRAQSGDAAAPRAASTAERARPVAAATPRAGAIHVDGTLDEAAWAAATPLAGFTQQRPNEGAPATERTDVRFVYDDEALYVGARMYDSRGAAGVTSRLARRDQSPEGDLLRIELDPYHDRLHFVQFDVSPSGWRGDAAGDDPSWDPVWEAATRVDSLGWTAEIRIPLSQLRFSRDSVQSWGLEVTRTIERKQERALWSFWRQNEPGGPAYYGDLAGLRIHSRPRHAELLPYTVARNERLSSGNPSSPFYHPHSSAVRIGGDLKYLVTSSLTLSAAVNPDFGQVEVDPAVVNLTAYETFFPERRPFFVEGADLFRFGAPGCNINCGPGLNLFYSRRIGRAPQGAELADQAGPYADVPESTDILGAAKLTGRVAGGFTVGVLDAVTRREVAEVATADGGRIFQPVEPLTNSFVSRVRREAHGGDLTVGGIVTSVNRTRQDAGLAALLPSDGQSAGVDAEYFWGRRTYRLYAALTASRVAGDSGAILRLQQSSARYLQRPDRGERSDGFFSDTYDPSATRLWGYGGVARLVKQGGSWIGDLNAAAVSPGFETNDLGFEQFAGWRWVNGTVGRQFTKPTRFYRTLISIAGAEQQWNYDGDVTRRDVSLFNQMELPNYWTVFVGFLRYFPSLSDRLTRGGPVVGQPGNAGGLLNLTTDPRRPVVLDGNLSLFTDDDGGSDVSGGVDATLRPASNVSLTLGPGFRRARTTDQYVTALADPTAAAFYGRRYVFAHLDETQLYMTTRANVTFTPNLSLELYAQPLLASADYSRFEEFAAPRQRDKLVYGRDVGTLQQVGQEEETRYVIDPDGTGPAPSFTVGNPDFNFRSLRGTGVLRWEWRPGSTLYLGWTQTRSGVAQVGDFDFRRDRAALFDAPADNVFLLKVSYWLPL
jgi:hypothetical protein